MGTGAGGAVRPGAASDPAGDGGGDSPRTGWLTSLTVLLALVVGCTIAFQSFYIWQLHGQVTELQGQVERLHAQLCRYQEAAVRLSESLSAAGREPLILPPPEQCP